MGFFRVWLFEENKMQTQTKAQIILEYEAAQARTGFKFNLGAYLVVNSLLVTIYLLTNSSFPWFLFPLCGWGFGLSMHYIFGVRLLGKKAREAQNTTAVQ
jgi:hypothetical protein